MNSKFRILVVDDEEKIIDVLEAYLKKSNYEVCTSKCLCTSCYRGYQCNFEGSI